jgi:3-hydroxybutyryl-CoA dehydrogenase
MNIGIIGLGTMGCGIMQVAAQNGCSVYAYDATVGIGEKCKTSLSAIFDKLIAKGKISQDDKIGIEGRIQYVSELKDLSTCDLIIEAIIEKLEIKKSVFSDLENFVSKECILATNTSSLSVTSIAASCKNPERFIGIHFFNPAPLMALVEIIPALQTAENVTQKAKGIIDSWKKTTVVVKDTPGFIVNRIARPYYSEAIRIFEEGIASKEVIDQVMQSCGFKMGPFALMDMIGHDVNYVVTETVWQAMFFDSRYKPSFSQKRLLEAGWLGKKSGRGFYDYSNTEPITLLDIDAALAEKISIRILLMLFNEAGDAAFLNIASATDIEIAMTKGVNYPKGLLEWSAEFGPKNVEKGLDDLYRYYGEDRYRCSPYFRK